MSSNNQTIQATTIVILSDFGTQDPFVGVMRGVIQSICSSVAIIDLTNTVEPFNIVHGAIILKDNYRYFPKGTIFLCVVDPGVGSERKPVIVKAGDHYFVAPDNGLLSAALSDLESCVVREIESEEVRLDNCSKTFHGRDIFAPAAGHLANGFPFEDFGKELEKIIELKLPEPEWNDSSEVRGEILYFDHFGNAISNIRFNQWREERNCSVEIHVKDVSIAGLIQSYRDVSFKEAGVLVNSNGRVEVICNQGSAKDILGLKVGDSITIHWK